MPIILLIALRILAFLAGFIIVVGVLKSAIRSFVLPRSAPDKLARVTFLGMRMLFGWRASKVSTYLERDRDQAWRDFAGWRVNNDTTLLALAGLTMAPHALWSSDRATKISEPPLPHLIKQ